MSRHQRGLALSRLFKIVMLMYSGGRLTQADFAAACGCSDRQVRRYLQALEEAEIPFDRNRERGYFLDPDWSPFHLQLSLTEVLALLLARQATVGREEMPFAHSSQSAFDKIAALLPANLREQLEDPAISYYSSGKRKYAEAPWGLLLTSIHKREQLEMDYYTIGRDAYSTRRIDPYYIVWLQGYCHLIAYCCDIRKKVINFALDGIQALRPTGETFQMQPQFSLATYLKGAAGPVLGDLIEIVVRFDAELARYARRRNWDFPHTLTDQKDGDVILTATVRGLIDIRKELLTWGRHAFVIEPEELRKAILEEAQAITDLYAST